MTFFHAIILGIVEGLTEFIPISSSGHLIVTHHFVGITSQDLAVDAVLQMGTIVAVAIYFWKDILNLARNFFRVLTKKEVEQKDKTMLFAIILGTIPAVLFGLLLQKSMETVFRDNHLVAYSLIAGSVLMYFAEKYRKENQELSLWSGIKIGLFQCLALVPGVSRSGATISGGLFAGLTRSEATRFSFLLSFPIIVGAGLKEMLGLFKTGLVMTAPFAVGTLTAFLVGLLCIHGLMKYLRNHSLSIFIWYRIVFAILILVLL